MLYITYDDLDHTSMVGIRKKVIAQTSVFEKAFGKTYYTCQSGTMLYLIVGEETVEKEAVVTRKDVTQVLCYWMEKYKITQTYIRYGLTDIYFLQLLDFLKTNQIKTVMEIPTYPYDNELAYGIRKVEDTYFRNQVCKYVDMITTYSCDNLIFGIPCINLNNGININDIMVNTRKKENCTINLVAVSSMAPWHGYERLLAGMHQYYKEKGKYYIYLRFIGEGQEENYYRRLSGKYCLESFVEFCGKVIGKDLDRIFDLSDIAVGSLGMYKTGLSKGSPIKGAEYCARGIPFIIGYNDLRFMQRPEFVMSVPNNEEAVDMNKVITFYERVTSKQFYQKEIRIFAEKHLTWESIMKPVIDYLNTEI